MFIEKLKPIDYGEPIYGRKTIGRAPKGAAKHQSGLSFYKHSTATQFSDRLLKGAWLLLAGP